MKKRAAISYSFLIHLLHTEGAQPQKSLGRPHPCAPLPLTFLVYFPMILQFDIRWSCRSHLTCAQLIWDRKGPYFTNYKMDFWVGNHDGLSFENPKLMCDCVLVFTYFIFVFLCMLIFGMLGYWSFRQKGTTILTEGSICCNWFS